MEALMSHIAKLFKNGRSQAVRLPAEFRFEGTEVYVRRDPKTGDVILSSKPGGWDEYFKFVRSLDIPDDDFPYRDNGPPQERNLFD
jgi:antitoxin VapB